MEVPAEPSLLSLTFRQAPRRLAGGDGRPRDPSLAPPGSPCQAEAPFAQVRSTRAADPVARLAGAPLRRREALVAGAAPACASPGPSPGQGVRAQHSLLAARRAVPNSVLGPSSLLVGAAPHAVGEGIALWEVHADMAGAVPKTVGRN